MYTFKTDIIEWVFLFQLMNIHESIRLHPPDAWPRQLSAAWWDWRAETDSAERPWPPPCHWPRHWMRSWAGHLTGHMTVDTSRCNRRRTLRCSHWSSWSATTPESWGLFEICWWWRKGLLPPGSNLGHLYTWPRLWWAGSWRRHRPLCLYFG